VEVRYDRGRAVRKKSRGIGSGQQMKPFQVEVALNEPWRDVEAGNVDYFPGGKRLKRKELPILDGKRFPFYRLTQRINDKAVCE
jgi:hypothetical protein